MDIIQIIVLAIIQGITEFLPISSSAHLIIANKVMNWVSHDPQFDIAVHLGSLLAICIYLRKDITLIAKSWLCSVVCLQAKSQTFLIT